MHCGPPIQNQVLTSKISPHGSTLVSPAKVGAFAAPTATESEVCRQFGVPVLGRTQDIMESFYAISLDRRLKPPAVIAISHAAHSEVFRS
jgi:hypothetical protein